MWLDIYVLSYHRNFETIEAFLRHFCVPAEIAERDEFEIWIGENQKYHLPEVKIPVTTRREALMIGLADPHYGFAFYFTGRAAEVKSGIIQFTYDGKMVFGISIEERAEDGQDNFERARQLALELMKVTRARKHFIGWECPPSLDEDEFDADALTEQGINSRRQ